MTVTVGQGGRSLLLLEIFLSVPLFLKLQYCTILSWHFFPSDLCTNLTLYCLKLVTSFLRYVQP